MEVIEDVNARFWTKGVPVEEAALQQIRNTSSLPILAGPVAVMPDVHFGIGATVALALWKRHKAGETMTALAKEFGVSRQCMSQVFQRYRLERVV